MKKGSRWILIVTVLLVTACSGANHKDGPANEKKALLEGMERALKQGMLDVWYPLAVDSVHGGFLSDFNYRWEPDGKQDKMIVTQARHLWTCSKAAGFYPAEVAYKDYALHGFKFLKEVMWDKEFGGFYNLVNQQGAVKTDGQGQIMKNAYGNAFGIYGLAAYHKLSGDQEALNLARQAFQWLEQHSYDPLHQGYFQFLQQDGTPFVDGYGKVPPKDQNSSIHLLEAFTELYQVWPDDTLRNRLHSLLVIVRDTITTPKGYMNLFFNRDWAPLSYRDSTEDVRTANFNLDHVSFGHDVETAFLLMEASEILGIEDDEKTLMKGKIMVDHALANGWDVKVGGLYDAGYYYKGAGELTVIKDTKVWWAQAEMLNTLLIMAGLYPEDEALYFEKFKSQWDYTQTYLIDPEHGGWYWGGLDKEPEWKQGAKGQIWKGNYHTVRSMMNCIRNLKAQHE